MNCNCEENRKMGKDFFLKNVKIKLFPGGKMPVYKTAGAACADCFCNIAADEFNIDSINELKIEKHERICQIKLQPVYRMEFEQTEELSETVRGEGGFGSTGK